MGITGGPQGNLALWFLRTLMLLFLFFPLWQWCCKHLKPAVLIFSLICILLIPNLSLPYFFECKSIGFFLLGMSIAALNWGGYRIRPLALACISLFWICAVLGVSFLNVEEITLPKSINTLRNLIPLIGILFWIGVYDTLKGNQWEIPKSLHKTFWVYCMHGSIVGYFTAGGLFLLGKSDGISIALAFTAFIPTLFACLLTAKLCETYSPKLYTILSGGR